MKCEFVVGQKVVCIKRGRWVRWRTGDPGEGIKHPEHDEICEIAGLYVWQDGLLPVVCVYLAGFDCSYTADKFRPLVEPDISVFNTILADVNAGKVKPVVVPA